MTVDSAGDLSIDVCEIESVAGHVEDGLGHLWFTRSGMRCEPASVQRIFPISLAHDLGDGTLVHWGDVDGPEVASWTLYLSRRLLSARVSAFLDFLKQVFPNGTPDEPAAYIGR
jgi:DNA-binding transcriptional LysR family regulator